MKTHEIELFINDELINLVVDEHDTIIAPKEYQNDRLADLLINEVDYMWEIGSVEWLEKYRLEKKKAEEAEKLWADLIPENGHLKKDGYIGGNDERN